MYRIWKDIRAAFISVLHIYFLLSFLSPFICFPIRRHADWMSDQSEHKERIPAIRKTIHPENVFMKINIASKDHLKLNTFNFRALIMSACKDVFGLTGVNALEPDIYAWDPETNTGIITCHVDAYVGLRAALTLIGNYDKKQIRITVAQSSPDMSTLAADSRDWSWLS